MSVFRLKNRISRIEFRGIVKKAVYKYILVYTNIYWYTQQVTISDETYHATGILWNYCIYQSYKTHLFRKRAKQDIYSNSIGIIEKKLREVNTQ